MRTTSYTTQKRKAIVLVSRLGQRRQVVIPREVCEALGLEIGDFVQIGRTKRTIVIRPKKLVDVEDVLTPEEEAIVRKGEAQFREGKSKSWHAIKHEMGL